MQIKLILILLFSISIDFPLNDITDICLVFFVISILLSINNTYKIEEIFKSKKINLFIISILIILNLTIPKLNIQESHSVFLNEKDIKKINNLIPNKIILDIKRSYTKFFDVNRMLRSSPHHQFSDLNIFQNSEFIKNSFTFSSDSFFQKQKYSRIVNKINFSSREDLRIGQVNNHYTYNLTFDKNLRRILPYYVIYEIPKLAKNSTVCTKGNAYYYFSNKELNKKDLSKINYIKIKDTDCIKLNKNYDTLYLIGYSINDNDNLEIKLKKNFIYKSVDFIKFLITLLIILIFVYSSCKIKISKNLYIYLLSIFSSILLTYIRDINLLTGLRYFRGGADGLLHYSLGRDILHNIVQGDYLMALKGGESIFYFMPGLRYFSAINNIIFGETTFGYFIACTFIPLLIFKIFEILTNTKIALILIFSFIFFPIFENMGFGYFNYIWQYARHHAETLSILFLLFSLFSILSFQKNSNEIKLQNFLIGISLSLAVFLRPNFLPTSIILFVFTFIMFFLHRKYYLLICLFIGYSFIFISLLHNYYFGSSLDFFTNSYSNLKLAPYQIVSAILNIISLNFSDSSVKLMFTQLFDWNPFYNMHRLLILIFIFYKTLFNKQKTLIYFIFASMITQHGVLIMTHPSSRDAYLAWLLTFILFIYYFTKLKKQNIKYF